MKQRLLAATAASLLGLSTVLSAVAIDLGSLRVCDDDSKSVPDRVGIVYALLTEEVVKPTGEKPGPGGGIDHDYVMSQIAFSLGKLAEGSPEAQLLLSAKVGAETRPEVKEAGTVALGLSGCRKADWTALVSLLKSNGRVQLREQAAHALAKAPPVTAIPALLDALQDSTCVPSAGDVGPAGRKEFPIRQAAAEAFRCMDVSVEEAKDMSRQIDRAAAVRLIQPALFGSDAEQTLLALAAMTRIGGEDARQALEKFVEINAANNARQALVTEAQKNLRALILLGQPPN